MMPTKLKSHFEAELVRAREAEGAGHLAEAWGALERAHVLGQFHAWAHLQVHGLMAAFAWRRRDARELLGQVPRLLLAAPGSVTGRAPRGNTGGANVGIFTPMPVPEALAALLQER